MRPAAGHAKGAVCGRDRQHRGTGAGSIYWLRDDDLERVSLSFGPFGVDPYIRPIPGRKHIAAIRRRADEKAPLVDGVANWCELECGSAWRGPPRL
jgi:hypothetical protein